MTNKGAARILPAPPAQGKKENIQFGDFTFAADDSMWAVSDKGLRRFDHVDRWPTTQATESAPGESFTTRQGLSSDAVWKVFIDREGTIWVGTNSGLDRLRHTALSTLPLPPAQEHDFSILAGDQGSIWTGNRSLPLTHVAADGHITSFPRTLGTICIRRDRDGAIWSAGGADAHLYRSSGSGWSLVRYPEKELGDDGRGIDEGVLQAGCRSGHWGLPGMRERASKMRGELRVGRTRNGGTQIDLQVPAGVVYRAGHPKGPRPWNPFRKGSRRMTSLQIK